MTGRRPPAATLAGSGARATHRRTDRVYVARRKHVLSRDLVCRRCRRRASAEVDHIVPLAQGGEDTLENLQGLCKACHQGKTRAERAVPKIVNADGSPITGRIEARRAWYRRKREGQL